MPRYVNEIPVYHPTLPQEQKITKLVEQILSNKESGTTTVELEDQIDKLIYRFYDLSYAEVKVLDPEFSISELDYISISID